MQQEPTNELQNVSNNNVEEAQNVIPILISNKREFNLSSLQQLMVNSEQYEIDITNKIINELISVGPNSYYFIILYNSSYNDKNIDENINDLLNHNLLIYFRDLLGIGIENPYIIYNELVTGLKDFINENNLINLTQFVDGSFIKIQNLIINSLENNQTLQDQEKNDLIKEVKRILNDRINDIKRTYSVDIVYIEDFIRNIILTYIYIYRFVLMDDQNINLKVWLFIIMAIIVFLQMIKDKRLYQQILMDQQNRFNR